MSLVGKVIEFYDSDLNIRKAIVIDKYAGIASIDKMGRVNNHNEPPVSYLSIDYLLCDLIEGDGQYLTSKIIRVHPSDVISAVESINFYTRKD